MYKIYNICALLYKCKQLYKIKHLDWRKTDSVSDSVCYLFLINRTSFLIIVPWCLFLDSSKLVKPVLKRIELFQVSSVFLFFCDNKEFKCKDISLMWRFLILFCQFVPNLTNIVLKLLIWYSLISVIGRTLQNKLLNFGNKAPIPLKSYKDYFQCLFLSVIYKKNVYE